VKTSLLRGPRVIGSISCQVSKLQDLRYKARCDRLMAERAAKQAEQAKARQ
jgi:hypothetical protein